MRRKIGVSVILILILIFAVLIKGIYSKLQKQNIISEKIERLPTFSFTNLGNELYNSSNIKEGPVLVVHFHPECEHCQYEISEILGSNIPLSGATIILISSAEPESIKIFLDQFNASEFPSVIPLFDRELNFENIFGSGVIPSSYVYDKKLNLVKVLKGEVKTETLQKALETK
jgi:hypothetical protein